MNRAYFHHEGRQWEVKWDPRLDGRDPRASFYLAGGYLYLPKRYEDSTCGIPSSIHVPLCDFLDRLIERGSLDHKPSWIKPDPNKFYLKEQQMEPKTIVHITTHPTEYTRLECIAFGGWFIHMGNGRVYQKLMEATLGGYGERQFTCSNPDMATLTTLSASIPVRPVRCLEVIVKE